MTPFDRDCISRDWTLSTQHQDEVKHDLCTRQQEVGLGVVVGAARGERI
jgi:hypothetical protein